MTIVETITFLQSVDSCSLARAGTLETLSLCRARPNIKPVSKGSVLGPVSISGKTSYRKISWNLETTRLIVWIIPSLWDLTGTSAAVLHSSAACQISERSDNYIPISWLRDFTRSYNKTSYQILKQGPGRPRFNIRQDILLWDLVKSRSREIGSLNHCISLKFDRQHELPVKFQTIRQLEFWTRG